eukprot:4450844-Lingulodinium_polyedra.AAC.1
MEQHPALRAVKAARVHGKRCLGCQAVLLGVAPPQVPKNLVLMCAHLDGLEERLAKKGLGCQKGMVPLPDRFQKVLADLRAAGAKAMEEKKQEKKTKA